MLVISSQIFESIVDLLGSAELLKGKIEASF